MVYLQSYYGTEVTDSEEAMKIIHDLSALTHAHKRSLIACGIYCSIEAMLMGSMDLSIAVDLGIYKAVEFYKRH